MAGLDNLISKQNVGEALHFRIEGLMNSNKLFLTVLLFPILLLLPAFTADLPPAPKGFSWVSFDETKSAFLKPDGWFSRKGKKGETWGYFITKENIDKTGKFNTGLTINIIPNIQKNKGLRATEYASAFIQEGVKSRKVIKEPWQKNMGPFQAFGVVLLNSDSKGGDFITHTLAIGNDTTGTMYVIIFEAPASSWNSAWKVGERMLQQFLIDSDI